MSAQKVSSVASSRLAIPELFAEARFEQVLILTYGADLDFYERVLRRHFGWFRNQIVLADGRLLADTVSAYETSGSLRHLNRSWIAAPVSGEHSVHAKAILLAGPTDGLLMVGSGNMNMGGYARNGECFTPYRWNEQRPDDLHTFTTLRDLTEGLSARSLVDPIASERLRVFWDAYEWWNEPATTTGPVRHNLDTPLGTQLTDAVDAEAVVELTVAAPFHDPKSAALQRLISELHPRKVRVLVQPDRCSVDPDLLESTLSPHKGTVHSINATGDDTAYLHAKIIHVRTKTRAICLTGSANCSMVALWTRHPAANLELANLAIGGPNVFDDLFDPAVVSISSAVSPSALNVSIHDDLGQEAAAAEPQLTVRLLSWKSPVLTGELSAQIPQAQDVSLVVEGRTAAATVTLAPSENGWTAFRAVVSDATAVEAVDNVAVVKISVDGIGEVCAVAYQVDRLREQDRRRVDIDRLRQAATLEIDDPDLHRALAALEGILIGDSVAPWVKAPVERELGADGAVGTLGWDEIDWAKVRRKPEYKAYGGLGGFGVAGSDLAAYLEALSRATRDLIDPVVPDPPTDTKTKTDDDHNDDEDDDEDVAGGLEGTDPDDPESDSEPTRRQSTAARNRRLLRNFIRRNLQVLEQPSFRNGAGPGVVVLNMIILNWLCWWVATSDEDRPGDLIEERVRLWELMWGDAAESVGYFHSLPEEYQMLALERFDDQRFEAVSVASIVDVWFHTEERTSALFRRLRKTLRAAVVQQCWQVTAGHVVQAAQLIKARPTTEAPVDPSKVIDILWDVASEALGDDDVLADLAQAMGATADALEFSFPTVVIEPGTQRQVKEAQIRLRDIDLELAIGALRAWLAAEDLPYYRLRWEGGVALYRTEAGTGWVYFDVPDEMIHLGELTADWPAWSEELLASRTS